jgi:hypothetical protein
MQARGVVLSEHVVGVSFDRVVRIMAGLGHRTSIGSRGVALGIDR